MPLVISSRHSVLDRAVRGSALSREEALRLYTSPEVKVERLAEAARQCFKEVALRQIDLDFLPGTALFHFQLVGD